MRAAAGIASAACALAMVACGGGEEEGGSPAVPGDTRLVVEVRPEGPGGPVQRRVVRSVPPEIDARDFEPVPADAVCTELYGGPQTARVTGTLDGRRIDAAFRRTNGCEIARWDRLAALLGRVRGGPGVP